MSNERQYDAFFETMAKSHSDWRTTPRIYSEADDGVILCLECLDPVAMRFQGMTISSMAGVCEVMKQRYMMAKWDQPLAPAISTHTLKSFEERVGCQLPGLIGYYLTNISGEFACSQQRVRFDADAAPTRIRNIDVGQLSEKGIVVINRDVGDADVKDVSLTLPLGMSDGVIVTEAIIKGPGVGGILLDSCAEEGPDARLVAPLWAYMLEPCTNSVVVRPPA